MFISLEGLPGSGKTTLANNLCNKNTFIEMVKEIIDNRNDPNEQSYYIESDLLKYKKAKKILKKKHSVIMDRSFLSTLAFNSAHDKVFQTKNFDNVFAKFQEHKTSFFDPCVYVHIKTPLDKSISRKKRGLHSGEIWTNKEFLKQWDIETEHLLAKQTIKTITFNSEKKSIKEIESFLLNLILLEKRLSNF